MVNLNKTKMPTWEEVVQAHHEKYESDEKYRAEWDAEIANRDVILAERKELKDKEGRYTLSEATAFIAKNARQPYSDVESVLKRFFTDAGDSYMPGSSVPTYNDNPQRNEMYWDDLNKCIEIAMPRLDCKFPDPKATAVKVEAVKPGITKGAVINAFEGMHFDRDKWSKYLGDPPDWLKDCQVMKGKQGDNKVSATWNPVLIAAALLDKKVDKNKLNAVFVQLKDWADEWREASAQ